MDFSNLPVVKNKDILIPIADGASYLENILSINRPINLYRIPALFSQSNYTLEYSRILEKASILQPKIIYNINTNRTLLKKYVDDLNGFPLLLKEVGSSNGIGTIKIESWQNLISTVDFLAKLKSQFAMREFIQAKSIYRLLVLGDKVISSADFVIKNGDFRNASVFQQIEYSKKEHSVKSNKTAIEVAKKCNLDFAGLDFIETNDGKHYLLEVNYPTGFVGLDDFATTSIAEQVIIHLINKSKHY